jgi:hypothetical protein
MSKNVTNKLNRVIRRKAFGYETSETVEEYALIDGEMTLVKKKVSTKEIPPDTTALKMLLDISDGVDDDMSEEEIKKEKLRLIRLLMEGLNETSEK